MAVPGHTVVVGAGLAGLSATWQLARALPSCKITVCIPLHYARASYAIRARCVRSTGKDVLCSCFMDLGDALQYLSRVFVSPGRIDLTERMWTHDLALIARCSCWSLAGGREGGWRRRAQTTACSIEGRTRYGRGRSTTPCAKWCVHTDMPF